MIKLLNNKTPVLTSLKVIPIFSNNKSRSRSKSNHFYNYFNDEKYWTTTQEYYNNLNEIENKIYDVSNLRQDLNSNNKYDFSANLNKWNNQNNTIEKANIDDINALLYSQNSMFIMGTMTTTVLLIFMIYVMKN